MPCTAGQLNQAQTTRDPDPATLFVSLELSKSKWLATVLSPGGDKMSRRVVAAGDWSALLGLLLRAKAKAEARLGKPVGITAIHEAGLDGFSVHRMLERDGVESHVGDPAPARSEEGGRRKAE